MLRSHLLLLMLLMLLLQLMMLLLLMLGRGHKGWRPVIRRPVGGCWDCFRTRNDGTR